MGGRSGGGGRGGRGGGAGGALASEGAAAYREDVLAARIIDNSRWEGVENIITDQASGISSISQLQNMTLRERQLLARDSFRSAAREIGARQAAGQNVPGVGGLRNSVASILNVSSRSF